MLRRIENVEDVVAWGMCVGCGACAYTCPNNAVSLVNVLTAGIRPQVDAAGCESCGACLVGCPGYTVDATSPAFSVKGRSAAEQEIGKTLEIWQGYACDAEIRFRAASGGVMSALALYCLEHEGMGAVTHTGPNAAQPWRNETGRSRNRSDLLARSGSRYAPASPCDGLGAIEAADAPGVFMGKPCDAAAAVRLSEERSELADRIGLVMTHFCAGTPSTQGTLDLITSQGINPDELTELRYRGKGWPGEFRCETEADKASVPYPESWDKLYKYVPFRCRLCCHGMGQVSDIACGDAWQDFDNSGNPGLSLVLVRTERGRILVHNAMLAGYVHLESVDAAAVMKGQMNLLKKRRQAFGRLLAMKLLLIPTPRFAGFELWSGWNSLSPRERWDSITGTLKRIIKRGLWRRQKIGIEKSIGAKR